MRLALVGSGVRGQTYVDVVERMEMIDVPPPREFGHAHHDLALLTEFLDRLERCEDPTAGIQDAYMSGAVAFAALESMQTGGTVDVLPLTVTSGA